MVDRINGIGNYNYPLVRGTEKKEEDSTYAKEYGQGLIKDPYENAGVVYEPGNSRTNESAAAPKEDIPENGVRLDISSLAKEPKSDVVEEDFVARAKRIFFELLDNVKTFFNALWNGNDAASEVPEELMEGDFRKNAAASGFKTTEERLQELLNKDKRGHLVKNSDLLTYYDRSGHISKVNPSDRARIMEGDYKDIYL